VLKTKLLLYIRFYLSHPRTTIISAMDTHKQKAHTKNLHLVLACSLLFRLLLFSMFWQGILCNSKLCPDS